MRNISPKLVTTDNCTRQHLGLPVFGVFRRYIILVMNNPGYKIYAKCNFPADAIFSILI